VCSCSGSGEGHVVPTVGEGKDAPPDLTKHTTLFRTFQGVHPNHDVNIHHYSIL